MGLHLTAAPMLDRLNAVAPSEFMPPLNPEGGTANHRSEDGSLRWNLSAIARVTGVSRRTLSRYADSNRVPHKMADKLVTDALDVHPWEVWGWDEYENGMST